MDPAIARTQIRFLKFLLIRSLSFVFRFEAGIPLDHYRGELSGGKDRRHFRRSKPVAFQNRSQCSSFAREKLAWNQRTDHTRSNDRIRTLAAGVGRYGRCYCLAEFCARGEGALIPGGTLVPAG
jgi:hypothetical protein